jgi:hypothetical protein
VSVRYQFQLFRDIVRELLFRFDDAMLFRYEANEDGKLKITQGLHFERNWIFRVIHSEAPGMFVKCKVR